MVASRPTARARSCDPPGCDLAKSVMSYTCEGAGGTGRRRSGVGRSSAARPARAILKIRASRGERPAGTRPPDLRRRGEARRAGARAPGRESACTDGPDSAPSTRPWAPWPRRPLLCPCRASRVGAARRGNGDVDRATAASGSATPRAPGEIFFSVAEGREREKTNSASSLRFMTHVGMLHPAELTDDVSSVLLLKTSLKLPSPPAKKKNATSSRTPPTAGGLPP